MREDLEKYLELATILRDPKNGNMTEDEYDTILDEMDFLWYSMTDKEQEELEALLKELR